MRLFEAIIEANHRAVAGDSRAGVRPSEFREALPVVALTCIDPRLNPLIPEVLGVPEEAFIWLRNAGNIVSEPFSSTMRSLALACAIKGGKEIAVIGHSDCRVKQTSITQLLEIFRALGINRASLPDNLTQFFGLFASESQNVINAVSIVRQSPLVSPRTPVHGLLLDLGSGRLDWLVNGYDQMGSSHAPHAPFVEKLEQAKELASHLASFNLGEMRFPEVKIGDLVLDPNKWIAGHESAKAKAAGSPPHGLENWLSEVEVLKGAVRKAEASSLSENEAAAGPPPKQASIPVPPPIPILKKIIRKK